jgi:hypothetical protein
MQMTSGIMLKETFGQLGSPVDLLTMLSATLISWMKTWR